MCRSGRRINIRAFAQAPPPPTPQAYSGNLALQDSTSEQLRTVEDFSTCTVRPPTEHFFIKLQVLERKEHSIFSLSKDPAFPEGENEALSYCSRKHICWTHGRPSVSIWAHVKVEPSSGSWIPFHTTLKHEFLGLPC